MVIIACIYIYICARSFFCLILSLTFLRDYNPKKWTFDSLMRSTFTNGAAPNAVHGVGAAFWANGGFFLGVGTWFLELRSPQRTFIELDDGKIYRKTLYLMVKTMVSCRFSLKPIHWNIDLIGKIPLKICWFSGSMWFDCGLNTEKKDSKSRILPPKTIQQKVELLWVWLL